MRRAPAWLILGIMMMVKPLGAQSRSLDGLWDGRISAPAVNFEVDIVVRFATTDGVLSGSIDIPAQGAQQLPLANVVYEHPRVHFEMTVPGQPTFEGVRTADSIRGDFAQGQVAGTFALTRRGDPPQPEHTDPLPYDEEEVTFRNGDVTLAGTLTIPRSAGPYPAVVLISGSGPQNRDEEIFGFKPFRVISDHLTRNGIAVLRYDDRGVGGSTGVVANSTSEDFAQDVLAAVQLLKTRPDVLTTRVGLLGHSEGGLVAPLAAVQSADVAFLVLLAAPGLRGEEILYAQGELILRASGVTEEAVRAQRALQQATFRAVRSGEGWDDVRREMEQQVRNRLDQLPASQREALDVETVIATQVDTGIRQVRTPWFKFFIDYDPRPMLRQVRVPVLALFGELDLQVPAAPNRDAMERALQEGGNGDHTLTIIPKANHLFLTATTGSPSEYASLEKTFVPGFLETITDWITARTKSRNGGGLDDGRDASDLWP